MAKNGHLSSVVSSGGAGTPNLTRAGVCCYEYRIRTKSELNPKLYWAIPQIAALVKEEGYDILHAHTRVTQTIAFFISKITDVPYVSTAHGFYKSRFGRRLFPAWGEKTIAISEWVADDLTKSHGLKKEKVQIIYNAVDLDMFLRRLGQQDRALLRRRYGIPRDAVVIGTLSRLVRDKGHEFLIEAVNKILPKFSKLYVLIVGDGREQERLEALMKERLPHNSRHLAAVQDTTAVFSVMDFFAHPAT